MVSTQSSKGPFGVNTMIGAIIVFALTTALASNSFAKQKVERTKQSLNLTTGVDEEVKIDYLPAGATLKGDYRKLSDVKISPETKTLKFSPKGEGTGVLTINDSR